MCAGPVIEHSMSLNPLNPLKAKKNQLISKYRKNQRKNQKSIRNRRGIEIPELTIWILMESFLWGVAFTLIIIVVGIFFYKAKQTETHIEKVYYMVLDFSLSLEHSSQFSCCFHFLSCGFLLFKYDSYYLSYCLR